MKKTAKKNNGFTLIEVIVALSIFIIGVVSLYPLLSQGFSLLASSDDTVLVATLARTKMAALEARGFQAIPVEVTTPTPFPDAPGYAYTYTYEDVSNDADHWLRTNVLSRLTFTVYWTTGAGQKEETFVTYVARMNPVG